MGLILIDCKWSCVQFISNICIV